MATLPCESFEAAIEAVRDGRAALAMLPCENSLAGPRAGHPPSAARVRPVRRRRAFPARRALPAGPEGRHHRRAEARALARRWRSARCASILRAARPDAGGARPTPPGAAEMVAQWNNTEDAAIASSLAAEIYGLEILRRNVEDAAHNTTRFYVMAPRPSVPRPGDAEPDDDLRVPRAQRAGGAVQGARRLRDQRREHDQAGELHAGRPVRRRPSSCATSTAIPSSRRCAARWRS